MPAVSRYSLEAATGRKGTIDEDLLGSFASLAFPAGVQRLPDFTHQSRQREGFRKEPNSLFQHAVVRDRIIGIPGDLEDLCIGRDFQDLLSQLRPCIAGVTTSVITHRISARFSWLMTEPSSGLFAISSPQSSNFCGVAWVGNDFVRRGIPPRSTWGLYDVSLSRRLGKLFLQPAHYFRCKPPANYLPSSPCQSLRTCLASNLKAGLRGW
jgi:hypothetical protein